jgi:glutathione S-transferase
MSKPWLRSKATDLKLYYRPPSPFARKCRIIARELKLPVEEVQADPRGEEVGRANPLARIPTLVLDDGSSLFDSSVICEYLNNLGGGSFFPGHSLFKSNSGRWRALGLAALGDGISEAALTVVLEKRVAEDKRRADVISYQRSIVMNSITTLERFCPRFPQTPTIGEIAVACALGYVDYRLPELEWRARNPHLSAWFEKFEKFPSMIDTGPGLAK